MIRLAAVLLLAQSSACASSTTAATPEQTPAPDAESSVESMYKQAQEDLADSLYPEALKGFGDVKTKFPYSKYAALADLRSADTQFQRAKFSEAIDGYRNFLKYHPNHAEGPYAMLQIGESYFEQIPDDWFFLPPSAVR